MIEIESRGPWPTNAVADIIEARDELVKAGNGVLVATWFLGYSVPITMHTSPKTHEELRHFITGTNVSYKDFFEKNNIAKIIEGDEIKPLTVMVSFDETRVQINNVQLSSDIGEQQ